jgi:cytochrome c oxidase subunit 3
MQNKTSAELLKEQRRGAAKPMLWIGIASMAMAFAGLTSGYVVSRSKLIEVNNWLEFALPNAFTYSTIVIVLSSITVFYALKFAKKGMQQQSTYALLATLLLGITFASLQFQGWKELHASGIFFTGAGSNPAGSWVYAISFFHILHVTAGLISLMVTTFKSSKGLYNQKDTLGIELSSTFWHFLDILWIYLFMFLLFIR